MPAPEFHIDLNRNYHQIFCREQLLAGFTGQHNGSLMPSFYLPDTKHTRTEILLQKRNPFHHSYPTIFHLDWNRVWPMDPTILDELHYRPCFDTKESGYFELDWNFQRPSEPIVHHPSFERISRASRGKSRSKY